MNQALSDYQDRNFLEYVSLASRETVYSAALGWLFGQYSPLSLAVRQAIIRSAFGIEVQNVQKMTTVTEWNKLDLLIMIAAHGSVSYVAVENKIKSEESDNQLASYDKKLSTLEGKISKRFLTLSGSAPVSGEGWQAVSYRNLYSALREYVDPREKDAWQLIEALGRLVGIQNLVLADETFAQFVFGEKKQPALNKQELYVREMRLRLVLQRIWMLELQTRLQIPIELRVAIGESRGQALIDVFRLTSDESVRFGLQLQYRTLKLFSEPNPSPKFATQIQLEQVERTHEEIRMKMGYAPDTKLNKSRYRGFRSYSIVKLPERRNLEVWESIIQPAIQKFSAVSLKA